ncbi:MAG: hypothetical protein GY827_09410, partial [Cytophagales bacterium]|nr:hypothetical protein [Cytophagales bacterium]
MMHKILLFFSLSILSGFHTIYELNTVRDEAQDAFEKQDWETAISKYQIILDTAYDERVQLNLAHAYWSQQDTANAELFYAKNYDDPVLQSIALNQMGVITFLGTGITSYQPLDDTQKETVKTSLNFLKEAIKTDKENMLARYNYEVLKYLLEQKLPENNQNQENQQNQQNQDSQQNQQNNDQQQNQQNQDGQQNQQNNDQQQNQQNQDGQQNQQNNDQQQNQQNQDGQQNQQNNDQQQNQDGQQNQQNNDQQQNQQNQDGQQNQQNNDQQQNQQNQDGQQNQQNND